MYWLNSNQMAVYQRVKRRQHSWVLGQQQSIAQQILLRENATHQSAATAVKPTPQNQVASETLDSHAQSSQVLKTSTSPLPTPNETAKQSTIFAVESKPSTGASPQTLGNENQFDPGKLTAFFATLKRWWHRAVSGCGYARRASSPAPLAAISNNAASPSANSNNTPQFSNPK